MVDTSVVSILSTVRDRHRQLREAVVRELQGDMRVICPIVLGELLPWLDELGGRRRKLVRLMLDEMESLPITDRTAEFYAGLNWRSTAREAGNDQWIAARALEDGIYLATADADFLEMPELDGRIIFFAQEKILGG